MSLTARISGRDHEPPSGGEVLERTKMSQQKRTTVGATALSAALVLTACSGAGGGGGGDAVAEETADSINRSEERRVGKEWRIRRGADDWKKKREREGHEEK